MMNERKPYSPDLYFQYGYRLENDASCYLNIKVGWQNSKVLSYPIDCVCASQPAVHCTGYFQKVIPAFVTFLASRLATICGLAVGKIQDIGPVAPATLVTIIKCYALSIQHTQQFSASDVEGDGLNRQLDEEQQENASNSLYFQENTQLAVMLLNGDCHYLENEGTYQQQLS